MAVYLVVEHPPLVNVRSFTVLPPQAAPSTGGGATVPTTGQLWPRSGASAAPTAPAAANALLDDEFLLTLGM